MKRIKQLSIWMIALLAITVTNPAWAADTQPPRPGSYSTIVSTQTIITINWTKGNDNVTPQNKLKYVVWWTKKSGGKWSNTDLITNISTYTLTGLEPDTEYIVQVWVYDEAGYGENYGERTVKTKAAADKEKPKPGSYGTITSTANSITLNCS
ncbi:fibronectin type III domain-containing protein [Tannerella forsythia]|nr:fibronectin type III domain-containing protein [Tannerella forsythia]